MATHPSEIRHIAQALRQSAPGLTTGHTLSPGLRERAEELAISAGLSATLALKANDNDLISVYLTALKDGAGAMRVAKRIGLRLDDTFFKAEPIDTPDPKAPITPQGPGLDAIRALIKQEVKSGALDPLQAILGDMVTDTDERLRKLAEGMDTMHTRLTDDFAAMAHTAAVEALKALTPTRIEVSTNHSDPVNLGIVHRDTAKIINALAAGVNVYLHGPAGSGKTTVARKCAEAFKLQFYFAAKVESEYMLLGFKDARGETVRTQFREAYEHGGVFLFDEMDASSPAAVVALNAALANGICSFPDGTIPRHADFHAIGAGNTTLTGANRQYAGRNQLDAASIDRFAFIEFGYDDELEKALAADAAWCKYVQRARAVVAERGLNHLITPRATYDGCKLLASGFDRDTVAAMVVFKGLDADTRRQIERAI